MKHDSSSTGRSRCRSHARSTRGRRRRKERGERRDVSFTGGRERRFETRGHRGIVLSNAHERRRLWFQRCETADADGWISRREQRARGLFPRAHARENARNAPGRGNRKGGGTTDSVNQGTANKDAKAAAYWIHVRREMVPVRAQHHGSQVLCFQG